MPPPPSSTSAPAPPRRVSSPSPPPLTCYVFDVGNPAGGGRAVPRPRGGVFAEIHFDLSDTAAIETDPVEPAPAVEDVVTPAADERIVPAAADDPKPELQLRRLRHPLLGPGRVPYDLHLRRLDPSTFSTSYSTIPGKVSATGHPGVEDCDIDMPATPERVWRALRNARRADDAPSDRL